MEFANNYQNGAFECGLYSKSSGEKLSFYLIEIYNVPRKGHSVLTA